MNEGTAGVKRSTKSEDKRYALALAFLLSRSL